MTVPALTTYSAGIGAFSSDWGNTVVQGGALLADLRGFQGLSNMTVWMVGTTAQGDGGQGMFVWNGSATTADDGGVTAIAVSGVTTGRWMRQIAISSTVIISGLAATTRSLQYLTGALTRWNLFTNSSPETGGNAGSNLELWRYSDAGAAISQVMWFNRATGAVTVTGSLALGTPLPPASGGTGLTAPGTSGNVLTSNGTVWVSSSPSSSGGLPVMRALTAGTLYTAPTGLKALRVFVSGATGGQSSGTARGGNGGSGYSEKYYSSPASTYAYAIGAGGSTAGGAGGTSSFDVITVTGSAGVTSSTGGAGGVGSGGDFNATGGTGGNGASYSTAAYAGGGGGAAGSRAGNGFAGAAGVATSASYGTATGGGGGGTGAVGSGVTGGAAKATLSATAISFFDISAPFTFSAGSNGTIGVYVAGVPCVSSAIPGNGPGGSGANSSEVTGYSYVSSGIGAGGAGGVGNTGSTSGSPGVIVVWEYM